MSRNATHRSRNEGVLDRVRHRKRKEAFLPRRVALGTFVWVFRFRNWRKIMNIEGKTEKCANPQCKCTDQSMGGCCSDSCKNAVEIAEPECHCGHPDCI